MINPEALEKLRYPVGRFKKPEQYTTAMLEGFIAVIAAFPQKLKEAVGSMNEEELNTPYRPDGWTIRQVVHHCADSHINSFIRFKLALTEEKPVIKPYREDLWAELADTKTMPIEASLQMIEGTHQRWVALLQSLSDTELERSFVHPEHGTVFILKDALAMYAWHCELHLAHIQFVVK